MTWSISISGTEGDGVDSEQHLIQLGEKAQAFVDDIKDLGVSGGSLYHSAGSRPLNVTPAAAPAADVSTPASPSPDAQPAVGAVSEPASPAPADTTGSEAQPVADSSAAPAADQGAAENVPPAYTQPQADQYVDPNAAPAPDATPAPAADPNAAPAPDAGSTPPSPGTV